MGTEVAGVAAVNGLVLGSIANAVLGKGSGVWSGVNSASGVATHFRLEGSIADAGALSTTHHRVQGTCGVGSGDYPLSSTTFTSGRTHTVDDFSLSIPVN
jgi:hypothetical protein